MPSKRFQVCSVELCESMQKCIEKYFDKQSAVHQNIFPEDQFPA